MDEISNELTVSEKRIFEVNGLIININGYILKYLLIIDFK